LSKLLLARLVGPQGGHNEEVGATGVGLSLESLSFDLPGHTSGKVRESWSLPGGHRLLVTTDRLSAFDRVIGLVPHKGQVLNQLAAWWFDRTSDIVANHVVSVPDPMAWAIIVWSQYTISLVILAYLPLLVGMAKLPDIA